jgi:hypothetical protein
MSETLLQHVRSSPPRLLAGVRSGLVIDEGSDKNHSVKFDLFSTDGAFTAKIRGYSLVRLNLKYKGPPVFVSPVSLQCIPGVSVSELFDSEVHGYPAEIRSTSARIRGTGRASN